MTKANLIARKMGNQLRRARVLSMLHEADPRYRQHYAKDRIKIQVGKYAVGKYA